MKRMSQILFMFLAFSVITYGQNKKDRPISYKDDLTFEWKNLPDSTQLVANSKIYAPIELVLSDRKTGEELQSIRLPKLDSTVVLQCQGTNIDSIKQWVSEKLKIAYYIGHPDLISSDSNFLYRFPFKKGKKYELSQGWNGKSSHTSNASRYALDFQLNVGEPVYAARAGIVIKAIDWFTRQGGPELRNAANRIVILHDDGTIASYVHLEYQGIFVAEGERVVKGQKIGISGLTGFTRGPHLHFVVRKERDLAIPVYFEGYAGKELKPGKRYRIK